MRAILLAVILAAALISAAEPERTRPGLFFREDWVESPAALPVTQEHVANPSLVLSLHGPGRDGIKKSNHEQPYDDPFYIWNGDATANWAVSLRHRESLVDLSHQARVVWRTKQQGFRYLRVILKLADGTWLIGNEADGPSQDWRIREFVLANMRWHKLDIESVIELGPAPNADLSRVEEVGFTDLMRGGRSLACSRLDWIEVYGHAVSR